MQTSPLKAQPIPTLRLLPKGKADKKNMIPVSSKSQDLQPAFWAALWRWAAPWG